MVLRTLFNLLRGYAGLAFPNSLPFPASLPFLTIHDFFLNTILLNPHFQAYPPSTQYQKQFWKWVIGKLEALPQNDEDPVEIDAQIYEHYLGLLVPNTGFVPGSCMQVCSRLPMQQLPPTQSYITRYWKPRVSVDDKPQDAEVDLSEYITTTLMESRATIESGTTGLRTWTASFVLAHYLILHPDLVTSRRVLELGSGIGFLGIIIASLQQLAGSQVPESPLWLTDVNDEVLTRCRENVSLPCNSLSTLANPKYRNLDWSAALDENQVSRVTSLLHDEIDADLIVGADIAFDPSLIPALVAILKVALQPRGKPKIAVIALTNRNENTTGKFLQRVHDASLKIVDIPLEFDRTGFIETIEGTTAHENIKIFQITT